MAGRNSQLVRVLKIHKILTESRCGHTVGELQGMLNQEGIQTSKRTIYRDLDAIDQSGIPLDPVESEEGGQRWRLFRVG